MRSSLRKARITSPLRPKSDSSAADAKRRGFLLALGLGGAGAAALAARKLSGVASNAATAPDDDSTKGAGYRATDHVKRYYETTKI